MTFGYTIIHAIFLKIIQFLINFFIPTAVECGIGGRRSGGIPFLIILASDSSAPAGMKKLALCGIFSRYLL